MLRSIQGVSIKKNSWYGVGTLTKVFTFSIILFLIPLSPAHAISDGESCSNVGEISANGKYECKWINTFPAWVDRTKNTKIKFAKVPKVDPCISTKSKIKAKQKVVASIVIRVNQAVIRAQATYDPSDARRYLSAYAAYTLGVVQMVQIAENAMYCFTSDQQASLISVDDQYSGLNSKAHNVSPLDLDPGSLRTIAAPRFYEWLYPNG
jgi:hypothetical protein